MNDEARFNWIGKDLVVVIETNMVLGGWMSALGADGVGLYTLYKCLAQQGVPASFDDLSSHVGMAKKTIRCYNLVFEWAGMVQITEGSNRYPNQYNVDAPPLLDEKLIKKLKKHIKADEWFNKNYNSGTKSKFLERLNMARPFTMAARRSAQAPEQQLSLFGGDSEPQEAMQALHRIGSDIDEVKSYMDSYPASHILDWIWYIEQRNGTDDAIDNPRRYLAKSIKDTPPKRRPENGQDQTKQYIPDHLKGIINR